MFGLDDPGAWPVMYGWCMTVFVTLCSVGLLVGLVVSDVLNPRTVFGHRCYGLFPQVSRVLHWTGNNKACRARHHA